jgi:hypothetical protein
VTIDDSFTSLLGAGRGLRPTREHLLKLGRHDWRVLLLDAGSTDLEPMVPDRDAVAIYDCASLHQGQFIALVAARDLMQTPTSAMSLYSGTETLTLGVEMLTMLGQLVEEDQRRPQWAD